jgi:hypothetical protein
MPLAFTVLTVHLQREALMVLVRMLFPYQPL